MPEMRGAEAVVKLLEHYQVEVVFGYPGGANLPLYDALYHSRSVAHVLSRHEQGAGLMAGGYARLLNKPGVCLATSGPGVTNLITALADAYLDSVPLIALTGQIPRSFLGTDAFQEVDTLNLTLPITKHNELVLRPEDLVPAIHDAFHLANTGRKGPVLIDIPRDIQEYMMDYDLELRRALHGYAPTLLAHVGQIKRSIRALKRAQRPLLLLGGGVARSEAEKEVWQLAHKTKTPVVRTLMGKATFPESDELFIGMIGTHGHVEANKAIAKADLVLAIGTKLSDRSTLYRKENFLPDATLIHLDIDPAEIGKTLPTDIPVVGDIKLTLTKLLQEINLTDFAGRKPWFASKNTHNILWKGDHGGTIGTIFNELSKIEQKLHITTDVGRHQMWATHFCQNPSHWPILTSGGLGTMGFGLPAAIGAWFADKATPVVNVTGDGSFFMNMQEFLIAVEYSIPLVVFIVNDMRLGMIREIQEARYGGRYIAHDFQPTNFVAIAEAFGGVGYKLTKVGQIYPTLKKALEDRRPTIIDLELSAIASDENCQLKIAV